MSCYIYFRMKGIMQVNNMVISQAQKYNIFHVKPSACKILSPFPMHFPGKFRFFLTTNLMSSELQIASDFIFLQLFIQKLWTTW